MKILFILVAASAGLMAQPVTVTGTLSGPGGDKLGGSCVFTASATFTAFDGYQVVPTTPTAVAFTAGNLRASLEPNDTGVPGGTYYTVNCVAPRQTVTGSDGKQHMSQGSWGPWLFIVKSPPNSSSLPAVLVPNPPSTGITVGWQQLNFSGLGNGCFSILNGNANVFPCGQLVSGLTWTQMKAYTWTQL